MEGSEVWDTHPPKGYKYGDSIITGIPNSTLSMCARDYSVKLNSVMIKCVTDFSNFNVTDNTVFTFIHYSIWL
jgi:hypothetical protein